MKSKKILYKKHFYSNSFRLNTIVILTNDYDKVNKLYDIDFDYGYFTTHKGNKVMLFSTKISKNDLPGVIAHECYHLVKDAVEERDMNCEETEAYMLTYLVNKTTKIIKKFVKTHKIKKQ